MAKAKNPKQNTPKQKTPNKIPLNPSSPNKSKCKHVHRQETAMQHLPPTTIPENQTREEGTIRSFQNRERRGKTKSFLQFLWGRGVNDTSCNTTVGVILLIWIIYHRRECVCVCGRPRIKSKTWKRLLSAQLSTASNYCLYLYLLFH